MVSFTVRFRFRSEDRAEVVELLRPLTLASREEPGCVTYVPHTVESEPDTVVIYEQYRDNAALEQHRGTEHYGKYVVGGLNQRMLDRQVENLTALI